MTRLQEFREKIEQIDGADMWTDYQEDFENLLDWYDIEYKGVDTTPEALFDKLVKAFNRDCEKNEEFKSVYYG